MAFSQFIRNILLLCLTGAVAGFVFALIPARCFDIYYYRKIFKFERNGDFYEKTLKIALWKDKLPQFSKMFHIGFDKQNIPVKDIEHYERFILETIRAEITHSFLILISPVYYTVNSFGWGSFAVMASIVANLPFIAIQRHNRIRITRILCKLKNKIKNCT